jgi:hypothetical protein
VTSPDGVEVVAIDPAHPDAQHCLSAYFSDLGRRFQKGFDSAPSIRRLLGELEERAAEHGARTVRLNTNRALVEAISLYRSAGYVEVTPFSDEPYASIGSKSRSRPVQGGHLPDQTRPAEPRP